MHTDGGVNLIPWDYSATIQAPNDQGLRSLGLPAELLHGAARPASPVRSCTTWVAAPTTGPTRRWASPRAPGSSPTPARLQRVLPAVQLHGLVREDLHPGPRLHRGGGADAVQALARPDHPQRVGQRSAPAAPVAVTATADDGALGASGFGRPTPQNVTAARIYVGTAPWDGGKAVAMKIQGKGTSVTATANVKQGAKQVLAYVQAKNADGNWGPAMAVWIPAAALTRRLMVSRPAESQGPTRRPRHDPKGKERSGWLPGRQVPYRSDLTRLLAGRFYGGAVVAGAPIGCGGSWIASVDVAGGAR